MIPKSSANPRILQAHRASLCSANPPPRARSVYLTNKQSECRVLVAAAASTWENAPFNILQAQRKRRQEIRIGHASLLSQDTHGKICAFLASKQYFSTRCDRRLGSFSLDARLPLRF